MRKLGAMLLALPVLTAVYLAAAARPIGRRRALGLAGAAGLVAVALLAGTRAAPSVAVPPSPARTIAAQLLDAIVTGHALRAPFTVGFDTPMDAASVAQALRITPDADVSLSWDAKGSTLTITPTRGWAPDTLYAITVGTAARAADGTPLAAPAHAVVMTAAAGSGTVSASNLVGTLAAVDTTFLIRLDRPVALAAVQAALRTSPAVAGTVSPGAGTGEYVFTPSEPLAPGTAYRVSLAGLTDAEGTAFGAIPALTVRTPAAPSVVRFRPLNGAKAQAVTAVLSVRFTAAMDRAATAAAFRVTANGKAVRGTTAWAERDTVLVFTPAASLPYGAKVVMALAASARSAAGVPLAATSGTFTVRSKPAATAAAKTAATVAATPKPVPKPAPAPKPAPTGSGGSGGAAASWAAVETYYLGLMNCTRTGGWVTSSGACSSPGGRNVAPLRLSAAISTAVSRPYAKYLATNGLCNHFYGGTPGDRLRRAGFTSYNWAENIGCEDISPYASVLGSHLFFQSEKPYNGGHYRNLMNSLYTEVGIGVWVSNGRTRLVIDFYRP